MFKRLVVTATSVLVAGLAGCSHNTASVIPTSDGEVAAHQKIQRLPSPATEYMSSFKDAPAPHYQSATRGRRMASSTLFGETAEPVRITSAETGFHDNSAPEVTHSVRGRSTFVNTIFPDKAPVVIVEDDPTAGDTYRLDSGDRVRLSVFEQRNLSRIYTIDGGGYIDMPLIGGVMARNLTTFELANKVSRMLGSKYIKNPKVSVEISTYRPFFILGEVRNSGQFPFVTNMTVRTAVAIAGGYTERANRRKILLTRRLNGKQFTTYVTAQSKVLPGDTLEIRERLF